FRKNARRRGRGEPHAFAFQVARGRGPSGARLRAGAVVPPETGGDDRLARRLRRGVAGPGKRRPDGAPAGGGVARGAGRRPGRGPSAWTRSCASTPRTTRR